MSEQQPQQQNNFPTQKMQIENDIQNVDGEQNEANQQNLNQQAQVNDQQYELYCEEVEQNSQRLINQVNHNANDDANEQQIQPVKNPVSAYMVFTMKWKQDNPTLKFNMSNLGELWKNLSSSERRQFEQQFRKQKQKYDLYIASRLISNPNQQHDLDSDNKFFLPLYRVKSIMKQDKYYAPKTEAVAAMARATQYFGQYFLEELKKIVSGKNRIDTKDLFQCISANQRTFGFLDCLIDDYAQSNKEKKTTLKVNNDDFRNKEKQSERINDNNDIEQKSVEKKKPPKKQAPTTTKPLPKGQVKLTDMFFSNSKK